MEVGLDIGHLRIPLSSSLSPRDLYFSLDLCGSGEAHSSWGSVALEHGT